MAYKDYSNEYYDISEKILELSDELSEEIVLTNIADQLSGKLEIFTEKTNYVSLFRRKYTEITSDVTFYDKEYVRTALEKVTTLVGDLMKMRYGISLGNDLDFYFPDDYLKDMETLYEFFYIRHFENLREYFYTQLQQNRWKFIENYSAQLQNDTHSKDIFVIGGKKKFVNNDDLVIVHFMNEIIDDIIAGSNSAYVLFDSMIALDPFEEFSARAGELLMDYGKGIIFEGDTLCYEKYMSVLKESQTRIELRNALLMRYLENVEIEEI